MAGQNIKVSVIAPVYGVEAYIDQFLDSIRKQTLQEIEVILVDDGSKDNCPAILDAFAKEDERYQVIHQENGGAAAARNAGLRVAAGEYLYIVDPDDWLEPNALEVLYQEAKRTGADLVCADWETELQGRSIKRVTFDKEFYTEDKETIRVLQYAVEAGIVKFNFQRPEFKYVAWYGGAPWRALIRRSIVEEHQLFFDPYLHRIGDDRLFTLCLYEYINSVAYVQQVVYHWRMRDGSYTYGYNPMFLDALGRLFERMEAFIRERQKDKMFVNAYYLRVILYLNQAFNTYFMNQRNTKSEAERFGEFKALVKTEPYRTAIGEVPIHLMNGKKKKISVLLLRMKLYKIYWMLKKRDHVQL